MSLNNKNHIRLTKEQVDYLSVNFGILSFSADHRERSTFIHLRGHSLSGRVMPEAIILRFDVDMAYTPYNTKLVYSNSAFEEVFLQAGIPLGE